MKKLLYKYRVLAGGALFAVAVTYVTGCCCPCYWIPTDIPVAEAQPLSPKVLPDMKDFKAPALDVGAQNVSY